MCWHVQAHYYALRYAQLYDHVIPVLFWHNCEIDQNIGQLLEDDFKRRVFVKALCALEKSEAPWRGQVWRASVRGWSGVDSIYNTNGVHFVRVATLTDSLLCPLPPFYKYV